MSKLYLNHRDVRSAIIPNIGELTIPFTSITNLIDTKTERLLFISIPAPVANGSEVHLFEIEEERPLAPLAPLVDRLMFWVSRNPKAIYAGRQHLTLQPLETIRTRRGN